MNCPDPVHSLLVQNPNLLLSCTSIENNQQQQQEQQQEQQQIGMNLTYDHSYSMQQSTGSHESSSSTSSFDLADSLITAAITDNSNETAAPPPSIERQFSFDQFIQQEEVSLESQREIRDEILDLNIFELLANEEPEMARLIDQASSLDPYGFGVGAGAGATGVGGNFLPQISVNTTSKILDSLSTSLGNHHQHHGYGLGGGAMAMPKTHSSSSLSSVLFELSTKSSSISEETTTTTTTATKPTIFKLEDLADEIPSQQNFQQQQQQLQGNQNLMMHASPSFKELCELLSMKKVNSSSSLIANQPGSNQPVAARNRQLKLLNPPSVDESSSKLSSACSTPASAGLKPSRTSMRLFQKRNIKKEPMDVEEEMIVQTTTTTTTKRRAAAASNVRSNNNSRKQKSDSMEDTSSSEESDDKSSSSDSKPALNSSNENSMDLTSFYESTKQNDDDDEDSDSDDDDEMDSDDSSSETFSGKQQQRRLSGRKSSTGGIVCLGGGGGLNGMSHHPIKKESNKEAATRYRLKKLSEKDKLFETRFNLEKENDSKRRQIELVQAEINYLKTILVQFILTKSCLNTSTQPPNSTATSI